MGMMESYVPSQRVRGIAPEHLKRFPGLAGIVHRGRKMGWTPCIEWSDDPDDIRELLVPQDAVLAANEARPGPRIVFLDREREEVGGVWLDPWGGDYWLKDFDRSIQMVMFTHVSHDAGAELLASCIALLRAHPGGKLDGVCHEGLRSMDECPICRPVLRARKAISRAMGDPA